MCGELLRSRVSVGLRLLILVFAGFAGLASGLALDYYGICPIIKRIWTPAWTLYSTGWCCLILATLYLVVDVLKWRWWTFPFVVVGVNSIAIYCMGQLLPRWTAATLQTHFGRDVFADFGWGYIPGGFLPTVTACLVGLVFWLICLWMYRQKIFIRI
jgi:predicted acyltransferase